jgi:hypothetical protein
MSSKVIFSNSIFKHDYEHSVISSDILTNDEIELKLIEHHSKKTNFLEKNRNFKILSKTFDSTKITKESFIEKCIQMNKSDKILNSETSLLKNDENNKLKRNDQPV